MYRQAGDLLHAPWAQSRLTRRRPGPGSSARHLRTVTSEPTFGLSRKPQTGARPSSPGTSGRWQSAWPCK